MSHKTYLEAFPSPQAFPYREDQVRNNAGGYTWEIQPLQYLDRFLILGTEGATYYARHPQRTYEAAGRLKALMDSPEGVAAVKRIVEVSVSGRAPKNDPALFALALATSSARLDVRREAYRSLLSVARTSTHLFHFCAYADNLRGWGRGLRRAVADWYLQQSPEDLAYQLIKYASRDGWTHKDALRLSHPRPASSATSALFDFATKGRLPQEANCEALELVRAAEAAKTARGSELFDLVTKHDLPIEAVPSSAWDAALYRHTALAGKQSTWLVRNLSALTKYGVIPQDEEVTSFVTGVLSSKEWLHKHRIHPLSLLNALAAYRAGASRHGEWMPSSRVEAALEAGLEASLGTFPTEKRVLYGLDVSGSMSVGTLSGTLITPREGAAVLALAAIRSDPGAEVMLFSDRFIPAPFGTEHTYSQAIAMTEGLPFGRTDCALPILWAEANNRLFDAFVVITDNETWYGKTHPAAALASYRRLVPDAALVVVGMTATEFSIGDPQDPKTLDVVGFDLSAPEAIRQFIMGV